MQCPQCARSVSLWRRDLLTGICPACQAAPSPEIKARLGRRCRYALTAVALLAAVAVGLCTPLLPVPLTDSPFLSEGWVRGDAQARGRMARDLVSSRQLMGKSPAEVRATLGAPDIERFGARRSGSGWLWGRGRHSGPTCPIWSSGSERAMRCSRSPSSRGKRCSRRSGACRPWQPRRRTRRYTGPAGHAGVPRVVGPSAPPGGELVRSADRLFTRRRFLMKVCILIAVGACLSLAEDGPKEKAVKADLDKLQGSWQLVSAEFDGEKATADSVRLISMGIRDNKLTIHRANVKEVVVPIPFTIDPTKKPKTFDQQPRDGKEIHGIFDLDGDILKICTAAPGKGRPTEFAAKRGTEQRLRVFKRIK
jgi:uncharacterized protein (TIGR03067 family)